MAIAPSLKELVAAREDEISFTFDQVGSFRDYTGMDIFN